MSSWLLALVSAVSSDGQREFTESNLGCTCRCLSVGAPPGDLRHLGTLIKQFLPYGFLRIHRNHAVNLARIQEIRRRKGREDWEVKLEPPVNRVLPVSRGQVGKLLKVFGAGK